MNGQRKGDPRFSADAHGARNGKLTFWVLGAVFTLLVMAGGMIFSWINARLTDVEHTQRQRGDRVVALEAKVELFEGWLNRVELKLDRVLYEREKGLARTGP